MYLQGIDAEEMIGISARSDDAGRRRSRALNPRPDRLGEQALGRSAVSAPARPKAVVRAAASRSWKAQAVLSPDLEAVGLGFTR
jgi:hypothetical protein